METEAGNLKQLYESRAKKHAHDFMQLTVRHIRTKVIKFFLCIKVEAGELNFKIILENEDYQIILDKASDYNELNTALDLRRF